VEFYRWIIEIQWDLRLLDIFECKGCLYFPFEGSMSLIHRLKGQSIQEENSHLTILIQVESELYEKENVVLGFVADFLCLLITHENDSSV